MDEQERLNNQAGSLAALEGAFALLVEHLAKAGAVDRAAYITDLRRLSELPGKAEPVQRAELRLLRMIQVMQ
ncbi:MAG: hypothetical protein E6Q69_04060 [Aquipseudomonas alcaligenes]|uniref:Uncharacterized protein n=1 Tax=Aquipseudomonas alcaligenes TaxID=43263 RepID=A0A5C7WC16_AQUAC|nr:MAG: hypothetical protein E6Q69_04060 [Pseudomonas alcaligenes]